MADGVAPANKGRAAVGKVALLVGCECATEVGFVDILLLGSLRLISVSGGNGRKTGIP